MDKNMTLEKRIAAELYCYQGKMSVFVDDLQGHTVEVGADEEFETASTIKAFILAALYLQAQRGKADLAEEITYEQSQFVDGRRFGPLRELRYRHSTHYGRLRAERGQSATARGPHFGGNGTAYPCIGRGRVLASDRCRCFRRAQHH